MDESKIREGMHIRFTPSGWISGANGAVLDAWVIKTVDGIIDSVNRNKAWIRVAYFAKGEKCYECFKLPLLRCERIKKVWA